MSERITGGVVTESRRGPVSPIDTPPQWGRFMTPEAPHVTSYEQVLDLATPDYLAHINRYVGEVVAAEDYHDVNGVISQEAWTRLVDIGVLAASFGDRGEARRQEEIMQVARILSFHDLPLGLTYGITTGLVIIPLQQHATEAQQKQYLGRLRNGERMGLAVTEENRSGTSALTMDSHFVKTGDTTGELTFAKRHQGYSGHTNIIAATDTRNRKVGLFIVDKDDIKTTVTEMEGLHGIPYGINRGALSFDERHFMKELSPREFQDLFVKSRILFSGMTLGHQERAIVNAQAYAGKREIGGKLQKDMAIPEAVLTMMETRRMVSDAILTRLISYRKDEQSLLQTNTFGAVMEANIAKVLTTAYALQTSGDRAELQGAMAYLAESGLQDYIDIWPFQIFEGSRLKLEADIGNEYELRQGSKKPIEHPGLFDEARADCMLDPELRERVAYIKEHGVTEVQKSVLGEIVCRLFALGCLEAEKDPALFEVARAVLNAEIEEKLATLKRFAAAGEIKRAY